MWKKGPIENTPVEMYKFSEFYWSQKMHILQEWNDFLDKVKWRGETKRIVDASKFIEFLNWIEKVNQWQKKEEWKRLVDDWFNKYDWKYILIAFQNFERSRKNNPNVRFEDVLSDAGNKIEIEIMWDKISKRIFGYYWNYLKLLKSKLWEKKAQEDMEMVRENTIKRLENSIESNAISYEVILDKEVAIREWEIQKKVNSFDELDKSCTSLTWEIKEKRDRLYKKVNDKLIEEARKDVEKLDKLYKNRIALSKDVHKAIDKRNYYIGKLEHAIQMINDLPWAETDWMREIVNKLEAFDKKNESILEYIETTNRILDTLSWNDGQLSFDF